MYLQELSVLNFKNHLESKMIFHPSINCFVGNNGSGKTNVLDAIHYLSLTKSFFTKQDQLNITYQQPFMTVGGVFVNDEKEVLIIERKSLSDLIASIKDGRYEEQSIRNSPSFIVILTNSRATTKVFMGFSFKLIVITNN